MCEISGIQMTWDQCKEEGNKLETYIFKVGLADKVKFGVRLE
jgi:hypothetical protein